MRWFCRYFVSLTVCLWGDKYWTIAPISINLLSWVKHNSGTGELVSGIIWTWGGAYIPIFWKTFFFFFFFWTLSFSNLRYYKLHEIIKIQNIWKFHHPKSITTEVMLSVIIKNENKGKPFHSRFSQRDLQF